MRMRELEIYKKDEGEVVLKQGSEFDDEEMRNFVVIPIEQIPIVIKWLKTFTKNEPKQ